VLPLWRSMHSLNLMLPKEERKAMLLRLYNDSSELIDHSKDRDRAPRPNGADAEVKKEDAPAAVGTDEAEADDNGVRLDAKDEEVAKLELESSRGNGVHIGDTNESLGSLPLMKADAAPGDEIMEDVTEPNDNVKVEKAVIREAQQ